MWIPYIFSYPRKTNHCKTGFVSYIFFSVVLIRYDLSGTRPSLDDTVLKGFFAKPYVAVVRFDCGPFVLPHNLPSAHTIAVTFSARKHDTTLHRWSLTRWTPTLLRNDRTAGRGRRREGVVVVTRYRVSRARLAYAKLTQRNTFGPRFLPAPAIGLADIIVPAP